MAQQLALFDLFGNPPLAPTRAPTPEPARTLASVPDPPTAGSTSCVSAAAPSEAGRVEAGGVEAGGPRRTVDDSRELVSREPVAALRITYADPAEVRLADAVAAREPQLDIFGGPHRERKLAERAVVALDAAGIREAAWAARRAFPTWAEVADWLVWADSVEWLLGALDDTLGVRGASDRALSLLADESARVFFPRLPPVLLGSVRGEAAARACDALLAEEGPMARLGDGLAAGTLPLRAGNAARAAEPLRRAVEAGLVDGATRAALGEALRELGEAALALGTWCDALLRDPASVDGVRLPGVLGELLDRLEELELRGDTRAWVPIVADLEGLLALPGWLIDDAPFGPAGAFAAELAIFRHKRKAGIPRESLFAHKRVMLELAPALREWVRRL